MKKPTQNGSQTPNTRGPARIDPEFRSYFLGSVEGCDYPGGLPIGRPHTIFGYLDIDHPPVTEPPCSLVEFAQIAGGLIPALMAQNPEKTPLNAASEAIAVTSHLLLHCGYHLEERNKARAYLEMFQRILIEESGLPPAKTGDGYTMIPFSEGIQFITDQKREIRALPLFRRFVEARRPDLSELQVGEWISWNRARGFQCFTLVVLREHFRFMWDRGMIRKRSPSKKIVAKEKSARRCA